MRNHRSTLMAFVALVLGSCEPTTSPPKSPLAGRWATALEALKPQGSYRTFLTFDGTVFVSEVRNYGLYAGQQPHDLSAYSRIEGTAIVEGDSLQLLATRLVTWDTFFGPNPPERVDIPTHHGASANRAHFSIEGNRLTLDYFSYPADAPVPTSRTYWRLSTLLEN